MTDRLEKCKALLEAEGCSCVIMNERETMVCRRRGVADLIGLYTDYPGLLEGAVVADKVIGKGAAALMILGKVREVYGGVVSRAALRLFREAGMDVDYGTLADAIINRTGTGICPVETLCAPCATPEECLLLIREFVKKMDLEAKTDKNSLK